MRRSWVANLLQWAFQEHSKFIAIGQLDIHWPSGLRLAKLSGLVLGIRAKKPSRCSSKLLQVRTSKKHNWFFYLGAVAWKGPSSRTLPPQSFTTKSGVYYHTTTHVLYKLAQMMTVSGDKHQISYIFPCQRRTLLLENSFGGTVCSYGQVCSYATTTISGCPHICFPFEDSNTDRFLSIETMLSIWRKSCSWGDGGTTIDVVLLHVWEGALGALAPIPLCYIDWCNTELCHLVFAPNVMDCNHTHNFLLKKIKW